MPKENLPEIFDVDRAASEFLIYQAENGESRVQVRLFEQSVWLTQRMIADLYQKSVKTINEHIRNIFEEKELDSLATIRKFQIVQIEGGRHVKRLVDFYNLDVILAVGYRVRSQENKRKMRLQMSEYHPCSASIWKFHMVHREMPGEPNAEARVLEERIGVNALTSTRGLIWHIKGRIVFSTQFVN